MASTRSGKMKYRISTDKGIKWFKTLASARRGAKIAANRVGSSITIIKDEGFGKSWGPAPVSYEVVGPSSRRTKGRTEGGVWSRLMKSPDAKYFKNPNPSLKVKKGKWTAMLWAVREGGPWQGRIWVGAFPTTTTATRKTKEGIVSWARTSLNKISRVKNPQATTEWIKAKAVRVMKGKVQIRR